MPEILNDEDIKLLKRVVLRFADSPNVDPDVAEKTVEILLHGEAIDEEIAAEINADPRDVRKVLYRLNENAIATFRKEIRDEYQYPVYSWKLNLKDALRKYIDERRRDLEEVEKMLSNDLNHPVFHCGNEECPRLTFEEAMECEFRCPNCGEMLHEVDVSKERAHLKRVAEEIKTEIEMLERLREKLG